MLNTIYFTTSCKGKCNTKIILEEVVYRIKWLLVFGYLI